MGHVTPVEEQPVSASSLFGCRQNDMGHDANQPSIKSTYQYNIVINPHASCMRSLCRVILQEPRHHGLRALPAPLCQPATGGAQQAYIAHLLALEGA